MTLTIRRAAHLALATTAAVAALLAAPVGPAYAQDAMQQDMAEPADLDGGAAEAAAAVRESGMFSEDFARAIEDVVKASVTAGMAAAQPGPQAAAQMRAGADSLERGAVAMRAEAAKMQNQSYRTQMIAKAAADGKTITHEEMIAASTEMAEGAEEMAEGAKEMRAAAVAFENPNAE